MKKLDSQRGDDVDRRDSVSRRQFSVGIHIGEPPRTSRVVRVRPASPESGVIPTWMAIGIR